MKTINKTALIFFIFSIVVSFTRAFYGDYFIGIICIPLGFATFLKGKKSKVIEVITLVAIGLYTQVVEPDRTGMFILSYANIVYFIYIDRKYGAILFTGMLSLFIGATSYVRYSQIEANVNISGALLEALFYAVSAIIFAIVFRDYTQKIKSECSGVGHKTFQVIEKLQQAFNEVVDILKNSDKGE